MYPLGIALSSLIRRLVSSVMPFLVLVTRKMWRVCRAINWWCQRWTCLTRAGRARFITRIATSCASHTICFALFRGLWPFLIRLSYHAVFIFHAREHSWWDIVWFFLSWAFLVSGSTRFEIFLLGVLIRVCLICSHQFIYEVVGLVLLFLEQRLLFTLKIFVSFGRIS